MEKIIFDARKHLSEEEMTQLEHPNKKEKEEDVKDGYLLAINHQFFTTKGILNDNVMTIQETNELREILQKVLQTADPAGYESGLTYIRTSNVIVEFVHTSNLKYLNEISPSRTPIHMDPINLHKPKFNPFSDEASYFADTPDLFKTQLTPFVAAMPMSCIGCCNENCLFKKVYKNGNITAPCPYAKRTNTINKKEGNS